MTSSMIKYETIFESTNNLPMMIAIGHGENADLEASFTDNGVSVNLSGYTARAIYQPKSKWGTDVWYECPCEISANKVIAHWGNTYDNGENAVKLFMHLVKDGKLAYPAIYHIKLFETPGFTPSAIEPIPETIDFSQYTLLNAPWVLPSDLSGYATNADATLSTVYSQNPRFTEWVPVNYTFTVEWKENLNHWIFNFNGTEVGDSTGEWANPNATSLSFNYNGIQLEANRERLDVGYVLGSQTDKPLQPMGDYATIDDVDSKPLYTKQLITIPASTVSYTINIADRTEYGVKVSDSGLTSLFLEFPDLVEGKVIDFIVDIDNTQNSGTLTIHLSHNWFYAYDRFVEEWMTIFDTSAGKYNRFHFRETGLSKTVGANTRPVIYIEKLELFMLGY